MPLMPPRERGKKSTKSVEIDPQTRTLLRLYARFSDNDEDQVICWALQLLFKTDRDFLPWAEEQHEEPSSRQKGGKRLKEPFRQAGPAAPAAEAKAPRVESA